MNYDALRARVEAHRQALAAADGRLTNATGYMRIFYEQERDRLARLLAALVARVGDRPEPGPEERAFLDWIAAADDDQTTRLVYADWLDEHDRPEEAAYQRRWPEVRAARDWLRALVRKINHRDYARDGSGEIRRDPETGEELYDETTVGHPHTFDDLVDAGYAAVHGEEYCFGSDAGADFFRGSQENREAFFRNWSLWTGEPVPDRAVVDDPPFRCAC